MGLERIILQSIIRTVKNTAKFDAVIESIQSKFKDGCPPKEDLLLIIKQKNQITEALTQTSSILNTLNVTGNTLETIISTISSAVTVIKAIPVPTSIPPGIGIPLNIITAFSDALDILGDALKIGKAQLSIIPEAVNIILPYIQNIIDKLNALDQALSVCIIEQNLDPNDVGFTLSSVGNLPNTATNVIQDQTLLSQLSPNSQNPLLYKGYKLELQYDPKNQFSFPARRIKAVNNDTQNVLFNTPNGVYSFSSSTQVLVNEAKFRIDQYVLKSPIELPSTVGATGNEETRNISPFDPPTPPTASKPPRPDSPPPFQQFGDTVAYPGKDVVNGSIIVSQPPINVTFSSKNSSEKGEFGVTSAYIRFDKGNIGKQTLFVEGTTPQEKTFVLNSAGAYKYELGITNTNTKDSEAKVKFETPSRPIATGTATGGATPGESFRGAGQTIFDTSGNSATNVR